VSSIPGRHTALPVDRGYRLDALYGAA